MKKQVGFLCVILTIMLLFITSLTTQIRSAARINHLLVEKDAIENLRKQEVSENFKKTIFSYSKKYPQFSPYEYLSAGVLTKEESCAKLTEYLELLKQYDAKKLQTICNIEETIWSDLKYFPVPHLQAQSFEKLETSFEDSWMLIRTFGGTRGHEGTDIMATLNQRGYYPVVSITDGTVEKIGWLTQGGYRIGIRAPHGGYFYYAHLYDYAKEFQEGEMIKAGELLGFMGDSGYSEIEGTVGNFDVHLHIGIYYTDENGLEVSINPYFILKYLSDKTILCRYELE
ncbi:MAG: M23 family metallopeptidase [Lachnospiraceae bacterium]